MFHWIITFFFRKSNSFIIVFKDKVSDFIGWNLFYISGNICLYYNKNKKVEKKSYIDEKIAWKIEIISNL